MPTAKKVGHNPHPKGIVPSNIIKTQKSIAPSMIDFS